MMPNITAHALYRYIERVLGFDWTELRAEYEAQDSVHDADEWDFICWVETHVDLTAFRNHMAAAVERNGVKLHRVVGIWPIAWRGDTVVTILPEYCRRYGEYGRPSLAA